MEKEVCFASGELPRISYLSKALCPSIRNQRVQAQIRMCVTAQYRNITATSTWQCMCCHTDTSCTCTVPQPQFSNAPTTEVISLNNVCFFFNKKKGLWPTVEPLSSDKGAFPCFLVTFLILFCSYNNGNNVYNQRGFNFQRKTILRS